MNEYHAIVIRLIVKADSPADAELYARAELQSYLANWFDESKAGIAPSGSLMHYAIGQSTTTQWDKLPAELEPKPSERTDNTNWGKR